MASLITHLLVGKHVFQHIHNIEHSAKNYSAFLLGCLLVDVNRFSIIDKSQTHFVKRKKENSKKYSSYSCENFLSQLDKELLRPWETLSKEEQVFIAGYLCHLAADEIWKEFGWQQVRTLKMSALPEFPVTGTVMLTAYDMLCKKEFTDFDSVTQALNQVSIPDVLVNISHDSLLKMWEIIRSHIIYGSTPDSYIQLLALSGETEAELEKTRKEHDLYWEIAITIIREAGGVNKYIQTAIKRAVDVLPLLFQSDTLPKN
ncbi:MAG: zinc dependent phospholipase C family protein [Pseudomonadota bacterium]